MKWSVRFLILGWVLMVAATPSQAQKTPKIDSLLVRLPIAKAEAMDRVLEAFARAGLDVTDNAGSTVESRVENRRSLIGVDYTRTVRALLFGNDSSTTVLIRGEETREDNTGFKKHLRIDNRAGGKGKDTWRKMVAVATALDGQQVPPEATPKN